MKLKSPTCRILKTRNHARIIAARIALLARDAPATILHGLFRNVWIFAMGLSESTKLAMSPYNSVGSRATVYEPVAALLLTLGSLEYPYIPLTTSVSEPRTPCRDDVCMLIVAGLDLRMRDKVALLGNGRVPEENEILSAQLFQRGYFSQRIPRGGTNHFEYKEATVDEGEKRKIIHIKST